LAVRREEGGVGVGGATRRDLHRSPSAPKRIGESAAGWRSHCRRLPWMMPLYRGPTVGFLRALSWSQRANATIHQNLQPLPLAQLADHRDSTRRNRNASSRDMSTYLPYSFSPGRTVAQLCGYRSKSREPLRTIRPDRFHMVVSGRIRRGDGSQSTCCDLFSDVLCDQLNDRSPRNRGSRFPLGAWLLGPFCVAVQEFLTPGERFDWAYSARSS